MAHIHRVSIFLDIIEVTENNNIFVIQIIFRVPKEKSKQHVVDIVVTQNDETKLARTLGALNMLAAESRR